MELGFSYNLELYILELYEHTSIKFFFEVYSKVSSDMSLYITMGSLKWIFSMMKGDTMIVLQLFLNDILYNNVLSDISYSSFTQRMLNLEFDL